MMKHRPVVFSLVHEQSVFMTAIMSVLTFLAVITLGIALSIGSGVIRWNQQWNLFATVQTLNSTKTESVEKILRSNSERIKSVRKISESEMTDLMRPWISGSDTIKNFLPTMWEIEFQNDDDMKYISDKITPVARFMTHANALRDPISTGIKLMLLSGLVLLVMLGAIGICILYITKNTAMLHKRELEILNQIGANDSFVARQMQIIVAKIAFRGCGIGFICALPVLLLILSVAHNTRSGLMSMLTISGFSWIILILLPIAIITFAIIITKRTTLKILKK